MERLAAPAPVWSAPLKVPPVPAVAGPLARLLADAMAEERPEAVPQEEDGEGPDLRDSAISPLWAPSVLLEEEPAAAADAYSLAGAGWVSPHEGRHLDLTI